MVSVDQDHAFLDQHLLQLGIKLGYLTVVSRVPCARIVRCLTRYEGRDSSIIDYFSSIDNREVISGFYWFIQHHTAYLVQNLPLGMVIHSGQN